MSTTTCNSYRRLRLFPQHADFECRKLTDAETRHPLILLTFTAAIGDTGWVVVKELLNEMLRQQQQQLGPGHLPGLAGTPRAQTSNEEDEL